MDKADMKELREAAECAGLSQEFAELEAELVECKRDAERFVWLADRLQDIEIDLAEPSKYLEDDDN